MRRWLLFFVIIVCVIVYIFRLLKIPDEDVYLKKIFDSKVVSSISYYDDKKLIMYVEVVDEPSESAYVIDIVGKIRALCLIDKRDTTQINFETNSKTDKHNSCIKTQIKNIKKTRVRISKSKLNTDKINNPDILIGDMLAVEGELEIYKARLNIENFTQSPSGRHATTTQIDFQQKDKYKNIFSKIDVKEIIEIKKSNEYSFRQSLINIRKSIESSIAYALPNPESNLAAGLVISGKDSLPKNILEEFKQVGLIHIVVLSGSNVSIISQALFKVLSFAPRFIQVVLGIFLMSCFALMTGASPPVVRSVLMSSLPLLCAPLVSLVKQKSMKTNTVQDTDGVNNDINSSQNNKSRVQKNSVFETNSTLFVLIAVALIMSIHDPLLPLHNMSFQLSFLATFGLIVLTKPIANRLSFIPNTFGLRDIISSSLATQVYIAPLLLHMSGSLSAVFLIANIVVLPLLPLVMFFIFLIPLSSFIFPILTAVIGGVSYQILSFILKFTHWLSTFPLATVEFSKLGSVAVLVIYFFLFICTAIYLAFPHTCE